MLPVGDCAISIEFGETIDMGISGRVLELDRSVAVASIPGIVECVPTYRALLVHFDPLKSSLAEVRAAFVRRHEKLTP